MGPSEVAAGHDEQQRCNSNDCLLAATAGFGLRRRSTKGERWGGSDVGSRLAGRRFRGLFEKILGGVCRFFLDLRRRRFKGRSGCARGSACHRRTEPARSWWLEFARRRWSRHLWRRRRRHSRAIQSWRRNRSGGRHRILRRVCRWSLVRGQRRWLGGD